MEEVSIAVRAQLGLWPVWNIKIWFFKQFRLEGVSGGFKSNFGPYGACLEQAAGDHLLSDPTCLQ